MAEPAPAAATASPPADPRIRVGVSSCLLGEAVRFDGGHKRDDFLLGSLSPWVDFFPVCPEVEMGMSVPRESIRLVGDAAAPRLVGPRTGTDYTETMQRWADARLEAIADWHLHGYVLKKDSPSCGLFRVRVYGEEGMPQRDGRGLFAARLVERFPLLAVEEEGRLKDPRLRESFIDRLFTYERWTRSVGARPTRAGLVAFHTDHKLTLMAHDPAGQRELGRIVASLGARPFEEVVGEYVAVLARVMAKPPSRGRHTNALQHAVGFFKEHLDAEDKRELAEILEAYRRELVPLVVPVTLVKHHARRHPVPEWLRRQVYLNPYPRELMLRNRI